jgi:hypothetical protein
MSKETLTGSKLPQTMTELPKHGKDFQTESDMSTEALGSGSFTTFWTWRANGVHQAVRFNHSGINANSRVFVSISEFNSDAAVNRFIGSARMAVYNVAPFNGGFFAWVEISWSSPLNVRFDVLVDP